MGVYVTRDSDADYVEVWPATVGIRKFHGCVVYGAAWRKVRVTARLYPRKPVCCEELSKSECRKRFGFYPKPGEAWHITSRGKRSPVDIDFTN